MVWPFSGGRAKKFKHVLFNDDEDYAESDNERISQKDTVNPNSDSRASRAGYTGIFGPNAKVKFETL
jgi:hypothetical protein